MPFNELSLHPSFAVLATEFVILTYCKVVLPVFLEDTLSTSIRRTADLLHGTVIVVVGLPQPSREGQPTILVHTL